MENGGQQENFSCTLTFFTQKRGDPTKPTIPEDGPQKAASFDQKRSRKNDVWLIQLLTRNRNYDVFSYIFLDF